MEFFFPSFWKLFQKEKRKNKLSFCLSISNSRRKQTVTKKKKTNNNKLFANTTSNQNKTPSHQAFLSFSRSSILSFFSPVSLQKQSNQIEVSQKQKKHHHHAEITRTAQQKQQLSISFTDNKIASKNQGKKSKTNSTGCLNNYPFFSFFFFCQISLLSLFLFIFFFFSFASVLCCS